MKNILFLLHEINDTIRPRVDNINRGGCGILASIVSRRLKKYVNTKIAVYSKNKGINTDNIRSNVSNTNSLCDWRSGGLNIDHIYVEFKYNSNSFVYDIDGVNGKKSTMYNMHYSGNISIEECESMSLVEDGWNIDFDRNDIPFMERVINNIFVAYDKRQEGLSL